MQPSFAHGPDRSESTDLAFTDPLTALGNHRRFSDKIDRLISNRADDPAPFTVGILDLDGFKPINDLFGRKAGDAILVQVAMRLRAAMDAGSTVARVGSDEFAFLYPMVFSEEAAAERAIMLIEILSAPYDRAFLGTPRLEFAGQHRHHRIVAQLVVVVQVFIAERHGEDALANQCLHFMLDQVPVARVREATAKRPTSPIARSVSPSRSAPASEVIVPPSV
ncbi:diguanylate cyclase (GGDEF) domain-containing protein [Mesorhizobium muleiense]|uniref:Diguanylate cyclase (GGDEF) domain-containing protein n=1 Tax=Mesorhizobium muleiense TaxID=1004279 RepID=A0A1G9HPY2_9HYPH|nr:GGDEF domain-containing protein [Mesorhizobium muleiense]SDL14623.1 diguanylate cyclase (GGDEF) domain-containing protein [Mesorhizobium muleiense]